MIRRGASLDPAEAQARERAAPAASESWLQRWTTLAPAKNAGVELPGGLEAWAQTTGGIVAMLLSLQFATGSLLAFYYVPYAPDAQTTVAYIEKGLSAGHWLRALHHFGSQWLTLFLALHVARMFFYASYRRRPVAWLGSLALLALVLGAGATGYSLPWDVRAVASTHVMEGLAGALPVLGPPARHWLLGGADISPLTLVRLFALHVLVTPAVLILTIVCRFFVFREPDNGSASRRVRALPTGLQLARHAVAASAVFLALALYAGRFAAPLGPPAGTFEPGYLPRPGAQFLWLLQLLKYLPGRVASVVAVAVPALLLLWLASLPFVDRRAPVKRSPSRRTIAAPVFGLVILLVAGLTVAAYVQDRRDPLVRQQLARQSAEEAAFRASPFLPARIGEVPSDAAASSGPGEAGLPSPTASASPRSVPGVAPDAYLKNCAICHGDRGEGFSVYPKLIGVSNKPRRSVEDILAIIDDPASYGLRPPMKSFADKMTDPEKRDVAEWVVSLKKRK